MLVIIIACNNSLIEILKLLELQDEAEENLHKEDNVRSLSPISSTPGPENLPGGYTYTCADFSPWETST